MLNNKNICFFIENLWKTEYKNQYYKHLLSQYDWIEKTVLLSSLNFKMKNKIKEEDVVKINKYKHLLLFEKIVFPPIIVLNNHIVIDGFHRCSAYNQLNIKNIPAFVGIQK